VVLILFVLDLKIYLNDLENLFVKKRKRGRAYLLLVAWKTSGPACFPFSRVGRAEPSLSFLPTQRGPAQSVAIAARFLPPLFH
jgi:hypothetical protein